MFHTKLQYMAAQWRAVQYKESSAVKFSVANLSSWLWWHWLETQIGNQESQINKLEQKLEQKQKKKKIIGRKKIQK